MSLFESTLKSKTILQGQVLDNLAKIPFNTIDCSVTSIPFYKVRKYGAPGEWGLEKDVGIYLDRIAKFLELMRRVTKPSGTFWMETGDTIDKKTGSWYGIPEELLTIAKRKGWIIVSKIVWRKRNAFPLSTQKRFSPKYTQIYGFAKTSDWYFDLDSVKIPVLTPARKSFNVRVREAKRGTLEKKYGSMYSATEEEKNSHDKSGIKKQDNTLGADGKPLSHYEGFNSRYDHNKVLKDGKNPGDFWDEYVEDIFDITVKSIKEIEHYATFPPDLPERIIKACCPKNGWVLDPFMGSGTTGMVAEKLGLNWIGIELKSQYVTIAKKRIGI